jgi:hypothetical protein
MKAEKADYAVVKERLQNGLDKVTEGLKIDFLRLGPGPGDRTEVVFQDKEQAGTIALAESRCDELSLNMSWITPQATANRPSSISLVQGNNLFKHLPPKKGAP